MEELQYFNGAPAAPAPAPAASSSSASSSAPSSSAAAPAAPAPAAPAPAASSSSASSSAPSSSAAAPAAPAPAAPAVSSSAPLSSAAGAAELYPDMELIKFLKKCVIEYKLNEKSIGDIIKRIYRSGSIPQLNLSSVDIRNIEHPFGAAVGGTTDLVRGFYRDLIERISEYGNIPKMTDGNINIVRVIAWLIIKEVPTLQEEIRTLYDLANKLPDKDRSGLVTALNKLQNPSCGLNTNQPSYYYNIFTVLRSIHTRLSAGAGGGATGGSGGEKGGGAAAGGAAAGGAAAGGAAAGGGGDKRGQPAMGEERDSSNGSIQSAAVGSDSDSSNGSIQSAGVGGDSDSEEGGDSDSDSDKRGQPAMGEESD